MWSISCRWSRNEKITCVIKTSDIAAENKYYVMVTRNGIIKRTEYNAYINVRKSGLIAINLDEGDELAWVKITNGSDDLILATRNGMSIRFNEEDARSMGRTARGVKAIALDEGDQVVGMVVAEEGKDILTVSQSGLGRRTDVSEYRIQTRGGKGLRNYYCDKNRAGWLDLKRSTVKTILFLSPTAVLSSVFRQTRFPNSPVMQAVLR